MDAHTLYPEDYLARGVARLRRGGADHVSGPQLAHGEGTWSRRVALALDTPAGPRRSAVPAALERRDRGRQRLHRRLAALGARGAQRLGRGLAQRPGLRAGRPHPRQRRAHPLPAGDEREVHPARQPQGARAPVLALRRLPGQDLRRAPREHAPLPPARAEPRAVAGGRDPPARRRCAGSGARPWRSGARRSWASRWPRRGAPTPLELDASAADVAALPAVFGAMHLAWGFGFLFGCVRFGPPLRALAHLARRPRA